MKKSKLVASGLHTMTVTALTGEQTTGLTAAGTDLAGAKEVSNDVNVFGTVASGSGARLSASIEIGDSVVVSNLGANALLVYPHSAAGTIDSGSGGAGKSVGAGKNAVFRRISSTGWICLLGA